MNSIAAQSGPHQRTLDSFLLSFGFLFACLVFALGSVLLIKEQVRVVSEPASQLIQPRLEPSQTDVKDGTIPIIWKEKEVTWTLIPRAEYQISARVLSKKRYTDWPSAVMPLDLALGWGDMSDPSVDEWIGWRQSDRWYYYRWDDDSPYTSDDIRDQSANVHIIPATDNLTRRLYSLRPSAVVLLEGLLVDVISQNDKGKNMWHTSLLRTDTGGGACEIFYVERLIFEGREYR